ncbi:MAG TPA: carboxypeptidase-like regulatory domain-containing protein [Nitrospirota bacterium]|nr:carboxypeptidase-like regulatory domain-containing protein [Nitrospirota bacterium]
MNTKQWFSTRLLLSWTAAALLVLGVVACKGSTGDTGTPAIDHGSISGTVKDPTGSPVVAAAISTEPSTISVQTDTSGSFTLASIPIGAYTVVASKAGYVDSNLTGIGVGAGSTMNVSLVLAPVAPIPGSLSGKVLGRKGVSGVSSPLAGAQVCVEGGSICADTQSDGTYTLTGVTPGFISLSASTTGYLLGETRQAAFLAAGATVTGQDITLSGMPANTATYVGTNTCISCHTNVSPSVVTAWNNSAHAKATDRTLGSVDVTGWPAAPATCNTPTTMNLGFMATDPTVTIPPATRTVFLVRWKAGCGQPTFEMAFDTKQTGSVVAGDTIIPVTGSIGGVATGAGQCGNAGIIPANTPCSANLGGSGATANMGWWQQEYLVSIASGSNKPGWVTWDTTNTPSDLLVLPAAWNQRTQTWIPAPDYNPIQSMSFSAACSGCHETGLSLVTDTSGNVTSYSAVSQNIGCEKCHGPGSSHVSAGGDASLIVNPAYLTAQSEREVCGQCHSQGVTSTSPAGALGFAWNSMAAVGGGNFIPGVHTLSDFMIIPAYGDPAWYWPSGFPSSDHISYMDLEGSVHENNSYEKLSCANCHDGHGGTGGPSEFQRANGQSGDQYAFQSNAEILRNDVVCLACHATYGDFASIALADVANYHVSTGGLVSLNGTTFAPTSAQQMQSTDLISAMVNSHMMARAAMPAYFDPTGDVSGMPVGRCSSCHMAKTSFTGAFFSGLDANGKTANVIGDVTSHVFKVAWPVMSLETWSAATTWDAVMPNACGSCHKEYRFGK